MMLKAALCATGVDLLITLLATALLVLRLTTLLPRLSCVPTTSMLLLLLTVTLHRSSPSKSLPSSASRIWIFAKPARVFSHRW